jgi:hypothetical protein
MTGAHVSKIRATEQLSFTRCISIATSITSAPMKPVALWPDKFFDRPVAEHKADLIGALPRRLMRANNQPASPLGSPKV